MPPAYAPVPPPYAGPYRPHNGLATAGLVLGILGFLWPCAILGIIFGAIGLGRAAQLGGEGRVRAQWGLGLGIAWIGFYVILIVLAASGLLVRG